MTLEQAADSCQKTFESRDWFESLTYAHKPPRMYLTVNAWPSFLPQDKDEDTFCGFPVMIQKVKKTAL